MDLEDYLEPEVAIAVAVTAAVASPPVRKALRKAAVYGLAGVLTAGDRLAAIGHGIAESAQQRGATQGGRTQPATAAEASAG